MEAFKDVHTGLGTLGSPFHIILNPNVTPIQVHPHRCPVAKKAKAAEAIRDLEKQGILKKVTEPTPWISNSVYREKPDGSLRVCIDPSQTINKAIGIPKYPIPTAPTHVQNSVDLTKGGYYQHLHLLHRHEQKLTHLISRILIPTLDCHNKIKVIISCLAVVPGNFDDF